MQQTKLRRFCLATPAFNSMIADEQVGETCVHPISTQPALNFHCGVKWCLKKAIMFVGKSSAVGINNLRFPSFLKARKR
jgi:hypothetical protein